MRRLVRTLSLLVILVLGATSCGGETPAFDGRLRVVATTTILGDVTQNVAGDAAAVDVLLPIGADPHDYQPSAQQIAAVQEADLVVANGLLLEEALLDVLDNAADDGANVVTVADQLDPLPFGDGTRADPHVWMDPVRMTDAARLIAGELAAIDDTVDWAANAEAYAAALETAHEEIEGLLAPIEAQQRRLVTNHDALGYFAARYGFEVIGTVIPGGATLAEPSSSELAELVASIEREGVRAIFAETTEAPQLAEAVAAEAGEQVAVVELYTGSLGEPGSDADTLIGMLVTNARRIAEALT